MTRTTTGVAQRVRLALRDSLWLVPLLCLVGGVGLCIAAAAIDQATGNALVPDWMTGTPELDRQLELLTLGVKRSFDGDRDIGNALTADQQGLGSGSDLTQDGNSRQDGRVRAGVQLRP